MPRCWVGALVAIGQFMWARSSDIRPPLRLVELNHLMIDQRLNCTEGHVVGIGSSF